MKQKLTSCVLLSSFTILSSFGQTSGCTDSYATNYNPSAKQNDGSCLYASTQQSPIFKTNLIDELNESSALTYFNNKYWTINDSGNKNRLYEINPQNGQIAGYVVVKNASNTDWECIAQSQTHLFIGDCGNNATGARKDLCILKISKSEIANHLNDSVNAEKIFFSYSDQTEFSPSQNATNFDCEAIIFDNDSIHIFTKNWLNKKCTHYRLPSVSGTYIATKVETFDANGLITDADFTPVNGNVILVGYKEIAMNYYTCFAWLLFDYRPGHYFSGNKRRIELGAAAQIGQTEGVLLFDDGSGYITNEKVVSPIITIPAALRGFDFKDYFHNLPDMISEFKQEEKIISHSYPNPCKNEFNIKINCNQDCLKASIFDSFGKKTVGMNLKNGINTTNITMLPKGLYLLKLDEYPDQVLKIVKE